MIAPASSSPQAAKSVSASDRRDRRVYVWWAVALTLLALLGVFCRAVVVPVWRVRASCDRYISILHTSGSEAEMRQEVERLGGPHEAAAQYSLYLRMPSLIAPDRAAVVPFLATCGTHTIPKLTQLLKDDDTEVRLFAARGLGYLKDPRATDALVEALKDSEEQVRSAAALSLGAIGDRRAVSALVDALESGSRLLRVSAAEALAEIGDSLAWASLEKAARDSDALVRQVAVDALGRMRAKEQKNP